MFAAFSVRSTPLNIYANAILLMCVTSPLAHHVHSNSRALCQRRRDLCIEFKKTKTNMMESFNSMKTERLKTICTLDPVHHIAYYERLCARARTPSVMMRHLPNATTHQIIVCMLALLSASTRKTSASAWSKRRSSEPNARQGIVSSTIRRSVGDSMKRCKCEGPH